MYAGENLCQQQINLRGFKMKMCLTRTYNDNWNWHVLCSVFSSSSSQAFSSKPFFLSLLSLSLKDKPSVEPVAPCPHFKVLFAKCPGMMCVQEYPNSFSENCSFLIVYLIHPDRKQKKVYWEHFCYWIAEENLAPSVGLLKGASP